MIIASVGSSSSGNSYIITTDSCTIILDVGLPAKRIIAALEQMGRTPEDVDAVLITHEHTDHVKSVRAIGRQCPNALFYASRGTVENTANFQHIEDERLRYLAADEAFTLSGGAGVEVSTFALSHDAAEPLGFTITAGGEKLAAVTDCGVVTDEIFAAIKDADILIFEANHDENMLMYGEYPYHLKLRIKSEHGHLSNVCAGETLAAILKDRCRANEDRTTGRGVKATKANKPLKITLSHLSFNNNAPFFARRTVEEQLTAAGFERDSDYILDIAAKDELTILNPMSF